MRLIASIGSNGELGKDNRLICPIKQDLSRFKELTTGGIVIVGGNTFVGDLGSKPLLNRVNLVMTRREQSTNLTENLYFVDTLDKCLSIAKSFDKPIWVMGGEKIYNLFLPLCVELYMTHIHESFPDATKFLKVNYRRWRLVDAIDNAGYSWCNYLRKI
jgi:dihydrofolate reductase